MSTKQDIARFERERSKPKKASPAWDHFIYQGPFRLELFLGLIGLGAVSHSRGDLIGLPLLILGCHLSAKRIASMIDRAINKVD